MLREIDVIQACANDVVDELSGMRGGARIPLDADNPRTGEFSLDELAGCPAAAPDIEHYAGRII